MIDLSVKIAGVQHLQGEIDKSGGKLFHGNNQQNLRKGAWIFFRCKCCQTPQGEKLN